MIAELAKFAIEILKLAPRYLIAVAVMAGALLFLPSTWLDRFGLDGFATANRQWLGLTFLASATLWAVAVVVAFWKWIQRKLVQRRVRQHVIRKLNSLTEGEKQILRYYYVEHTRTNMLRLDDGVAQGLVADRIIYRSASMGSFLGGFAHNITDLAWEYIHANPHVLQGSTNCYRTDNLEEG